jgi:PST family polysaccharide transporter
MPLTGSSVLAKFYDNSDYLVVGKVLGPGPLGYYTLAFRLAMLINERISSVINRVAFPSFANLKDDPPKVLEHWFALTKRVTLITFPLLLWLGFNAEDFIRVFLGVRWLPTVIPLQYLCGMTAVRILSNVVGQILAAVGYPVIVFRYDALNAIALPLAFLIGCKLGGLAGMGIAWCTVYPLVRFLFLLGARKVLHFSLAAYGRNLLDSLWVSLVCGALMAPFDWILPSGWLRLCLRSAIGGGGILLCIALSRNLRRLIADTISDPLAAKKPSKA